MNAYDRENMLSADFQPATDISTRALRLANLSETLAACKTPEETLWTIRKVMREVNGAAASLIVSTRGLAPGEYRVLRFDAENSAPAEKDLNWMLASFPVHRGGVISTIIETREPKLLQNADWSGDDTFADKLDGYCSVVAVPVANTRLPVDWQILMRKSDRPFTEGDLDQVVLRVALVGSLVESQALISELGKAHQQIDREVQRVGQIQRSLLADPLPNIPGLEIAASFETFGEAGGDLYDFVRLGEDEMSPWAVVIADASGHGPAAAVVIAIVQALLQSFPVSAVTPVALLEHVNRHLCARPIESAFVTAFVGVYDPVKQCLQFASAGHPPPLLLSADGKQIKRLNDGGTYALGIDREMTITGACVELQVGDSIILYTDGFEEARNDAGVMFDINGLESAILGKTVTPRELIGIIQNEVKSHQNGRNATDDQTIVALRIQPSIAR